MLIFFANLINIKGLLCISTISKFLSNYFELLNSTGINDNLYIFPTTTFYETGRSNLREEISLYKSFLKNSKFKDDVSPLDLNCDIKGLKNYSKSYLHHLIKSEEMLASMLISLHNIYFYQQFMREIRSNIKNKTFNIFYKKYINFFD